MEHELRREISLQPAGSSQQNKKVGPRKIGTRLLYPQSVTVTSFCDTRTSDILPPLVECNATRQTTLDVYLFTSSSTQISTFLIPASQISAKKSSAGAWSSRKNYYLCSWSHNPPATRSCEGKEPSKIGLRTRVLHFSENIGHLK